MPLALLSALVGYLLGSISFARLMLRRFAPDQGVRRIELRVGDATITSEAVSATTVRLQLGPRFGIATAILDMAKVGLPTLLFTVLFPSQPYALLTAAGGVAGHNWPIYHGFHGGRGVSSIIGAMLVIDPLGILICILTGSLLGRYVVRSYLFMTGAYLVLLIPWLWWRTGDPWHLAFALALNVIGWTARLPELRQYSRLKREGRLPPLEQIANLLTGREQD